MLKANALNIVIVISLLISILCSSLILFSFYSKREQILFENDIKLSSNLNSAVELILSNSQNYKENSLDLFGEKNDTVILNSFKWGIFGVGTIKAIKGKQVKRRAFIYGESLKGKMTSALFLAPGLKLYIVGNALIKGKAFIPIEGISSGLIGSSGFDGNRLVEGQVFYNNDPLMDIQKNDLEYLKSFFGVVANQDGYKVVNPDKIGQDSLINNSFFDSTLLCILPSSYEIKGKYKGNILFFSDTQITISSGAMLEDVIVVSKHVRVEKGFTGNLQIIGTDSVLIEESAHLSYPSSISLLNLNPENKTPLIEIKTGGILRGSVILLNPSKYLNEPVLSIKPEALIEGEVFCQGRIQHEGAVYGHVSANQLFHTQGGRRYRNYLVDGEINYSKLNKYYIGSLLLSSSKNKDLIKYLH
jgi:hypothetical protein